MDVPELVNTPPVIRAEARLARAFEYSVVAVAALAFAASYGFNYGFDNQVVYFLKSLALSDRSLLHADWFTNHTTQYHRLFSYFGALLLELNRLGWAVAITQFLAILLGGLLIYRLVKRVAGAPLGLAAYLLLLPMLFITRTSSVGTSYLFDTILQPSTLGALGSIAGTLFFVEERWFESGLCLAAGGAFHANYLVLAYPIFGLAHLALGAKDLKRRLLAQFSPLLVATLALSPVLLAASHTHASPEAQEILFRVRSPHHYNPARFERNFMPFAAWQMLGIGSGWLLHRTPNGRRLGAILCGLMITIWTGTLLTTLFDVPKVNQIFVWRVAPNADLAAQVMIACAVAQALAKPSITRRYPGVAIGLVCAGLGVFGLFFRGKENSPTPNLLLVFLGVVLLARALDLALDLLRRYLPTQGALVAQAKGALALSPLLLGAFEMYRIAPDKLEQARDRSTLLKQERGATVELYRWLRERSPKDAVFLTPPDLEGARYLGQRAIVVDWKAVPLIPSELLGWYERLCDVTGRQVKSSGDLGGYNSLDAERLQLIVSKYHPDFVVLRHNAASGFSDLPLAYQNGGYSVRKIGAPGAPP
jgi:4-amino-4-deoxy-L-arabinose transferase-like glycosyltransferase